jgi:hypothetical protein
MRKPVFIRITDKRTNTKLWLVEPGMEVEDRGDNCALCFYRQFGADACLEAEHSSNAQMSLTREKAAMTGYSYYPCTLDKRLPGTPKTPNQLTFYSDKTRPQILAEILARRMTGGNT